MMLAVVRHSASNAPVKVEKSDATELVQPAAITAPDLENETVITASPRRDINLSHGMLSLRRCLPLGPTDGRVAVARCLVEHVRKERRRMVGGMPS